MKTRISVTNEILNEDDSTFATITAEYIDDITMDNCRNIIARNLARKVFRESGEYSSGMWTAKQVEE